MIVWYGHVVWRAFYRFVNRTSGELSGPANLRIVAVSVKDFCSV
jgi:hypothetical protein